MQGVVQGIKLGQHLSEPTHIESLGGRSPCCVVAGGRWRLGRVVQGVDPISVSLEHRDQWADDRVALIEVGRQTESLPEVDQIDPSLVDLIRPTHIGGRPRDFHGVGFRPYVDHLGDRYGQSMMADGGG